MHKLQLNHLGVDTSHLKELKNQDYDFFVTPLNDHDHILKNKDRMTWRIKL